jgi:hypothetical protein
VIQVLNEPVDHALLTPFADANARPAEGVRQRVTLVSKGIMIRGDDHDGWQPC